MFNYFNERETSDQSSHTKDIFNQNEILTVHNLISITNKCLAVMHRIFDKSFAPKVNEDVLFVIKTGLVDKKNKNYAHIFFGGRALYFRPS